jgi:nuclear pore complex protein Nup62
MWLTISAIMAAYTYNMSSYMLATELHTHLDDLTGSLTQMIEAVNTLSLSSGPPDSSGPGDDPMAQIAQILSSHLESLQWIDGAVHEVEGKVGEVEKRIKESGHGNANSSGNGLKSKSFH